MQSAFKLDFSHSALCKMWFWSVPYISWIPLLIKRYLVFFLKLFLNFELNLNAMSHTHIHAIWFLILSQYFSELCLLYSIYKTVESPSLCVYYKYLLFFFFFQFDILEIDASGWLNVIKQIKQAQPVLNMENSGHWAYLKLLKVKHQNGFEGYLILTGARSQLTTLIKPQYIALHMSGNPRFQYYSKPEWCFLRCWRNVTYLFFPLFSPPLKYFSCVLRSDKISSLLSCT